MGRAISKEALTVYDKPFFINELLAAIQPETISPDVFDEMVEESRVYDLSTILTAMTRQIDNSGLVPNLIGVYDDPQEVLEYLMNLGHAQLQKIARFEPDLRTEIFETLKGHHYATLRALLALDDCQREVIGQLAELRRESSLAMAVRQATEEALKELYRQPEKIYSPTFDEVICYEDRESLYQGIPRICYPRRIEDGAVVEVWQFFVMPDIHFIHLPKPFHTHTVGHILSRITPKIYQRKLTDPASYDPRTPSGFIGLLGKVGGAFPRFVAKQIKKNEKIRKQKLQEQEIAATLIDLISY
ncbi:MAG: hypothetical protein GX491_01845 [Chloroflexi bacterium]|nr:hypothetical protein [Chloroflexota bacterium]